MRLFSATMVAWNNFIIVSLITILVHGLKSSDYKIAFTSSLKTLVPASTALVLRFQWFKYSLIQVVVLPVMSKCQSHLQGRRQLRGICLAFFLSFYRRTGAFVAGSNTVSNMMFSLFQFGVGREYCDPTWIVALQAVGGASGHNLRTT